MGRPVGSGAQGLEPCPEHAGARVVKNGLYGTPPHRRQRYRCYPKDGSSSHVFAGATPRLTIDAGSCEHCENSVAGHQGPRLAKTYCFPVVQAAEALVMVGQGVSYTETAERVRVRNRRGQVIRGSQMVGNWVEILGPVVTAEHAETSWPETVVLDHTWFMVTNHRTGTRSLAFCVLGAYGYPAGSSRGRTWALAASPRSRKANWTRLLRSLPGQPSLVITDGDRSLTAAVRAAWPTAFHKLCEHHLRTTAKKHLHHYGRTRYGDPMMTLLNDAFRSQQGWNDFTAAARGAQLQAWIQSVDAQVSAQVAQRASLPQHHSTGALDEALAKVREFAEPRAFSYRNAERTTRMLQLVRSRLNRTDDPTLYAASIRAHLDANSGQLSQQGAINDRRGRPSLR